MIHYDKIDVSAGTDNNKTRISKEWELVSEAINLFKDADISKNS